jgi:hypothetical protein
VIGYPDPELVPQGESGGRFGTQAAGQAPCSLLTSSWPGQLLAVLCFGTALLLALAALATVGQAKFTLVGFWICFRLWPRSRTGLTEYLAPLLAGACFLLDLWPLASSGDSFSRILSGLLVVVLLDELTAFAWFRPSPFSLFPFPASSFVHSDELRLNDQPPQDSPAATPVASESKS